MPQTPPAPSGGYSMSGGDAARALKTYYSGGGRDRTTIAGYQRILGTYPDGIVGPNTRAAALRYGVTL